MGGWGTVGCLSHVLKGIGRGVLLFFAGRRGLLLCLSLDATTQFHTREILIQKITILTLLGQTLYHQSEGTQRNSQVYIFDENGFQKLKTLLLEIDRWRGNMKENMSAAAEGRWDMKRD